MKTLSDFEQEAIALDERLSPMAKRPVDIMRPGWEERLGVGLSPLDEADVRVETERLLAEMIAAYTQGSEEMRAALRRILADHRSFAWATGWANSQPGVEGFRQRLVLFSMHDQGDDGRDALLAVQGICREATASGLDTAPVLREIAALSSGANRFGMESTCDMLLKLSSAR